MLRQRSGKGFILLALMSGLACLAAACGGPEADDPACTDGESRCLGTVIEACTEGAWVAGEDCTESGGTCEMFDGTATCLVPGPFDGMEIVLDLGDSSLSVDLAEMDSTSFEGMDAIRLTRIIEQAALDLPWDNQYNFIASDGFDVMINKYEGAAGPLPYYGELDYGYLAMSAEDGLKIFWADEANMPGALSVKQMDGGTIQIVPFEATELLVAAGEIRVRVDLSLLSTEEVVDYKYPEDGAKPMVPMVDVFAAAAVIDAADYAYKIYGNDGFSNNESNLMPYENTTHAWINPADRRVIAAEEWDTEECCWRVRNTVLLLGQ